MILCKIERGEGREGEAGVEEDAEERFDMIWEAKKIEPE